MKKDETIYNDIIKYWQKRFSITPTVTRKNRPSNERLEAVECLIKILDNLRQHGLNVFWFNENLKKLVESQSGYKNYHRRLVQVKKEEKAFEKPFKKTRHGNKIKKDKFILEATLKRWEMKKKPDIKNVKDARGMLLHILVKGSKIVGNKTGKKRTYNITKACQTLIEIIELLGLREVSQENLLKQYTEWKKTAGTFNDEQWLVDSTLI